MWSIKCGRFATQVITRSIEYARADDPTDARTKFKTQYSDPLNPTRTDPAPVSKRRMQLWHAIEEFCRERGAWVVSVPGHRMIRIECRKDSALPVQLTEFGYTVRHAGSHIRLDAGKMLPVDEIEIMLLGK